MANVFWYKKKHLIVDFMKHGMPINADAYLKPCRNVGEAYKQNM